MKTLRNLITILILLANIGVLYAQNDLEIYAPTMRMDSDGYYSKIPKKQLKPLTFNCRYKNYGQLTINNAQANLNIHDYTTSVFNTTFDINAIYPNSFDSTNFNNESFLPTQTGNYEVIYSISSDSIESDYSNNSDTLKFQVTDFIYARDNTINAVFNTAHYPTFSNGFFIGNFFDINYDYEVKSISVYIDTSTTVGFSFIGKIKFFSDSVMYERIATDVITINESDLGTWKTVGFISDGISEFLEQNTQIIAGIELYYDFLPNSKGCIGADNSYSTNYINKTYVQDDSSGFVGMLPITPAIRLHFTDSLLNHAYVSGKVYLDENENGELDSNEVGIPNVKIQYRNSENQLKIRSTNYFGDYLILADSGAFQLNCDINQNYFFTTDSIYYYNIIPEVSTSDVNFGVNGYPNVNDIEVVIATSQIFCNTPQFIFIDIKNLASSIQSGTLTVEIDSSMSFFETIPSGDSIVGNIIYSSFNNLVANDYHRLTIVVINPGIESIGDTLTITAKVESALFEENLLNNFDTITGPYFCSYDPNDKLVYPAGIGQGGYVLFNTDLDYTVRFQNTGNYYATNVVIRDTIDIDMDISSFELLASSHFVEYEIEGNLVTFYFNNIMLPDSTTDLMGSNGFVKYNLKPKTSLPENTKVFNTAYIYFDFNPPIVTNTTQNTYVSVLPNITSSHETKINKNECNIYPNPTSNIFNLSFCEINFMYPVMVFNIYGKLIDSINLESENDAINISKYKAGIYYIKFINKKGNVESKKMIKL